jgi:hypothetical protein
VLTTGTPDGSIINNNKKQPCTVTHSGSNAIGSGILLTPPSTPPLPYIPSLQSIKIPRKIANKMDEAKKSVVVDKNTVHDKDRIEPSGVPVVNTKKIVDDYEDEDDFISYTVMVEY